MYLELKGSIDNPAHLFKLVQLLTYFTYQHRKKHPEATTKDILAKWLSNSEYEYLSKVSGKDDLINFLDNITMPFVSAYYYENFYINLFEFSDPSEIKKEILTIIKDYWLPF